MWAAPTMSRHRQATKPLRLLQVPVLTFNKHPPATNSLTETFLYVKHRNST